MYPQLPPEGAPRKKSPRPRTAKGKGGKQQQQQKQGKVGILHFFLINTAFGLVCALLDTCCSDFLTIIAGVELHFRHESEQPVC